MKLARFLCIAVILTGISFAAFAADSDAAGGDIQYVEVKKHLSNVYVKHEDPKSDIIKQVRKGEYIELLRKGESWYEVKVDGKVGYLEARNGKVVNRKSARVVTLLLFILVLLCCAMAVVLYVMKQRNGPVVAANDLDDDLDDLDDD
jgi:hypothetical protein